MGFRGAAGAVGFAVAVGLVGLLGVFVPSASFVLAALASGAGVGLSADASGATADGVGAMADGVGVATG